MTKRPPTIVDIARRLEVSPSSVSRALRNAGKVGTKLRARIVQEAKDVGYSPNPMACAFRRQSSRLIGLVVPTLFSVEIDELVTNIQEHTQKHDYGVILGVSNWDSEKEIELLKFMESKCTEGIIIKSRCSAQSLEKIYQLAQRGVKVVSLLDKIDFSNVYSVVVDNTMGGYLATKHLLDLGHTDILYLTYYFAKTNHFSRDRHIGMLKAYREANIERPNKLISDASNPEDNRCEKTFQEFLNRDIDFSAVFAFDDTLAAVASRSLKWKGHEIPEDYSIIGFDDSIIVNKWCDPPLTVVKQPADQIGFEAVNLIIGSPQNSRATIEGNLYTLEPQLVLRKSTSRYNKAKQQQPVSP